MGQVESLRAKLTEGGEAAVLESGLVTLTLASLPDQSDRGLAGALLDEVAQRLEVRGCPTRVVHAGSIGLYALEPLVWVSSPGKAPFYLPCFRAETAQEKAEQIVELVCGTGTVTAAQAALPRILEGRKVLFRCGRVDPSNLADAVGRYQAYVGLERAIAVGPQAALEILEKASVDRRHWDSGATGVSWRWFRDVEADRKYLVVRAVDLHPWGRTSRLLLGADPHSVLEGLLGLAYALGATNCLLCVNEACAEEVSTLTQAVDELRLHGLLESETLGSGRPLEVEVREVPGLLVMGDDSALLRFLTGRQPLPHMEFASSQQPVFRGWPALVVEVETAAAVAAVLREPSAWAQTKVVTIWAEAQPLCSLEVPLGRPLVEVLRDVGEIAVAAKGSEAPVGSPEFSAPAGLEKITAVQLGGPAGPVLAPDDQEVCITQEELSRRGGFAGLESIRLFRDQCAVVRARDIMSYLHSQSCGQCVFCREGTFQILQFLEDLAQGRADSKDLALLEELAQVIAGGSICQVGMTASVPLLTSLRAFAKDFESHASGMSCSGTPIVL